MSFLTVEVEVGESQYASASAVWSASGKSSVIEIVSRDNAANVKNQPKNCQIKDVDGAHKVHVYISTFAILY